MFIVRSQQQLLDMLRSGQGLSDVRELARRGAGDRRLLAVAVAINREVNRHGHLACSRVFETVDGDPDGSVSDQHFTTAPTVADVALSLSSVILVRRMPHVLRPHGVGTLKKGQELRHGALVGKFILWVSPSSSHRQGEVARLPVRRPALQYVPTACTSTVQRCNELTVKPSLPTLPAVLQKEGDEDKNRQPRESREEFAWRHYRSCRPGKLNFCCLGWRVKCQHFKSLLNKTDKSRVVEYLKTAHEWTSGAGPDSGSEDEA